MTPSFGQTGNLIYAYITYSLMMMVYSAINVPYASLLGVMSPLPQDRNTLSTYRMVFAYIGSFIALLLFMPMVRFFSGNSDELADQQHGWTMAVVVIAILCAILFYGCFAWTKERVKPIKEQQGSLKDDLRDLLHNKPWWILLGAGVSALVFNSIRDGATVYYFKYFIIEEAYANVSLFGVSFVLSGLYLAVGQYCRRDLGRPIKQPDRKEKNLYGLHADRLGFKHPLFLARQDGSSPDIHVPSVHQYLCR